MIDPSKWGDFVDRRAANEDAKIRRCTCGTWCYGVRACGTCGMPAVVDRLRSEAAA